MDVCDVDAWDALLGVIRAAADRVGVAVDAARVRGALGAVAVTFTRRRAAPAPRPAAAHRIRLRRLAGALLAAEERLRALERDDRGRPRADRTLTALGRTGVDVAGWLDGLQRLRGQAERLLEEAEQPARPGPPRDGAVRAMVLEVAWVLHREGLPVSTYPEGLLALAARRVAAQAGRRLPEDIRVVLRPAVGFCRRHGGGVRLAEDGNNTLTAPRARSLPCRSNVTH